jgi:cobalamin biosynthesis protein CobW
MQSAVVQLDGGINRPRLEALLQEQIRRQGLLRLKGRAWLSGKSHPLQIQAVGPRLECWFDPSAMAAQRRDTPGLEVVALGLTVDATALRAALAQAVQDCSSDPCNASAPPTAVR